MHNDSAARVHQAVAAAQAVAARHGLDSARPTVLHHANNVVVRLNPSPVVAKVSRSTAGGWHKLEQEVAVARHLMEAGAPVVGPSPELPAGPHVCDGFAVSFWRHQPHDAGAAACGRVLAETLADVHSALADYAAPLASYLDRRVKRTGDALVDPRYAAVLGTRDQTFLEAEYSRIVSDLESRRLDSRPLHGDPHRGNFLVGREGCLMVDFESVCVGPAEWDLSALPIEGAGVFAVDEALLAMLRRLRSLCVVVWCAGRAAGSKELASAGRLHLELLKAAA